VSRGVASSVTSGVDDDIASGFGRRLNPRRRTEFKFNKTILLEI
jgi:hypothetical protein